MSTTPRKRVGLVGCGTIGRCIVERIRQDNLADIDFLCDLEEEKARSLAPGAEVCSDLGEVSRWDVDLVIEAANAEAMRHIALDVLGKNDFLPFTVTALADDAFREQVRARCRQAGTRLLIPHGGVLGLDGIFDGRSIIREVTFKTTKHPGNLGLQPDQVGVIYDGPTRGACQQFPRNVNVHAAVALMGLGFDRQHSIVVSDRGTQAMHHEITVRGDGLEWHLDITSLPAGTVTSSYTPESAASTVARILGGVHDVVLA